jgi:hypothetical protein
VPLPGSLAASKAPPIILQKVLLMAMPRPVPPF